MQNIVFFITWYSQKGLNGFAKVHRDMQKICIVDYTSVNPKKYFAKNLDLFDPLN